MNRRHPRVIALLLVLACPGPATAAGPYYARGSFYAGSGAIWSYDSGNELHDDGLHGDGAANDGVWAGIVLADQPVGRHDWKIANADWSENFPLHPFYSLDNAVLFMTVPGEALSFRLDLRARPGWQPLTGAVACPNFAPAGTVFELMGSAPELGAWNIGQPAVFDAGVWTVTRVMGTAGPFEFKFRAQGTWNICNLGVHYNMFFGDNFTGSTMADGASVRFEFDPADGRGRALEVDSTPAVASSWGRLKRLYR
jgi:hypothetical protein